MKMTPEEEAELERVVNAVDDLIQANRLTYMRIINDQSHHNIRSKQVVGVLHLLLKYPILELLRARDALDPE